SMNGFPQREPSAPCGPDPPDGHGRKFGQNLEGAETGAGQSRAREFPAGADCWPEALDRRDFLNVMAASLALAGAAGCSRQPVERIVPYVRASEHIVPGKPLFYATCATLGGFGMGVLVESHEGRPTKVEGNPDHPASGGGTD